MSTLREENFLWLRVAERLGFVPVGSSPINDLGLIGSPQITKSIQNLSIRYKTGPAILRRLPPLALQRLMQIPVSLRSLDDSRIR